MKTISNGKFSGERIFYGLSDAKILDSIFEFGESPLKECQNLVLDGCRFEYKYPLWYSKHISINNCNFKELSRSGIWYTDDISIQNCIIDAPKLFRRSSNIVIRNCNMKNAIETFWNCKGISLVNVKAKGDYLGLNSSDIHIINFELDGNYAFDGAKNIYIENAYLNSKDSFWNCENVILKNCKIIGEYLAWNSKNVKLIDCTIESNQGMCYIDNLVMENCKLVNTDLAFEYVSNVNATITTKIVSVKNPISGVINAKSIDKLILDEELIDKSKVEVNVDEV